MIDMDVDAALMRRGEKSFGFIDVGETSVNTYKIPVAVVCGASPGKRVCLLGGTHGTEYASIEALIRVVRDLDPSEMSGSVVAVTVLNGPHFEHRSAFLSPIDQLNQNRQFPGKRDGTLSQRTAFIVFEELVSKCDALADLHGGDIGEDIDDMVIAGGGGGEEAEKMAMDMARCFPTEYVQRLPDAQGLSMTAQKVYGIPCVTSEAGTPYPVRERHIRFHYEGVMNILRYFGVLPGEAVLADAVVEPVTYRFNAGHGGIWHGFADLGSRVRKGDRIGEVTDLFGNVLETVNAPEGGKVTFLRTFYSVNMGERLIAVTAL